MSKNEIYKLISLMMSFTGNDYYNFDDIILDEKVNDCLVKMYFAMLASNQQESDKYYNEFETLYEALNDEQKEIAKVEIAKILDIDYKPKIKKKEKRRDE